MNNECTSHDNSIVLVCDKTYQIWWKFDEILTETTSLAFEKRYTNANIIASASASVNVAEQVELP